MTEPQLKRRPVPGGAALWVVLGAMQVLLGIFRLLRFAESGITADAAIGGAQVAIGVGIAILSVVRSRRREKPKGD